MLHVKPCGHTHTHCADANLFEFGWNITDPKLEPGMPGDCSAPRSPDAFEACHEDNRCHSNQILRTRFKQSMIRDWETDDMLQPKGCLGTPCAVQFVATLSCTMHHMLRIFCTLCTLCTMRV